MHAMKSHRITESSRLLDKLKGVITVVYYVFSGRGGCICLMQILLMLRMLSHELEQGYRLSFFRQGQAGPLKEMIRGPAQN